MRYLIPILLLAGVLASPQNADRDPVIKVTVDLVQVDATVTDHEGRHAANLKPEDFLVLEDGKPQKLTHFSWVSGAAPNTGPGHPVAIPSPGTSTHTTPNLAPPPPVLPTEVRRTIVMIADDLGLSADDIPRVRSAMKGFVEHQMQPGDLVSVMTTTGGMGAMQQFTSDKAQLLAAIAAIHYVTGRVGQTWYEPTNIGDVAREVQNQSNARLNTARIPVKSVDSLLAVAYAVQGLKELPGRKAIALFSGGVRQSVAGIVEMANRASVVLYTFDPRGVASFFLTAVDVCAACSNGSHTERIRSAEGKREAFFHSTQRSLDELARGTGGTFFHDNNDLGRGLASAIEDMSGYYLLGYQPDREDFDKVRFHRIEVRMLRPGLQVRSRAGFMGVPDAAPTPDPTTDPTTSLTASESLRKALLSPFQAGGFPVRLSALYNASPEAGSRRRKTSLRATLAIDAHSLQFEEAPDGAQRLNLEVVAAVFGADNKPVAASDKTFNATFSPAEARQIAASGLLYSLDLQLPGPGSFQLRLAARDANSQRIGSASLFLDVPDFNRPGLLLSSLSLWDSDAARNQHLADDGVAGPGSPVTRNFAEGAVLTYDCDVFGATLDPRNSQPKVEVEIRLFHGPERIFAGTPIPLPAMAKSARGTFKATGEIKLPPTLPPGEYAVELIAHDRLQKRAGAAPAQWADFRLFGAPVAQ